MDGGDQKHTQGEPSSGWQYAPHSDKHASAAAADKASSAPDPNAVEWTASEFIDHEKGMMWYLIFGAVGLLLAIGVYLINHDIFSVVVIGIVAAILGYATSRRPRVMTYRLDRSGLTIGQRFHPYGSFKGFTVIDEGAFASITLMPLKRFMPSVSVYFAPDDEHRIVEALADHLPMQPPSGDRFDQVLRRIRF